MGDAADGIGGGAQPPATRVNDPLYKGSGSLLSGECTSTDFTPVRTSTDGVDTLIYAGFQGCNDDRPQCCPWPVATNSPQNDSPTTVNVEVEPEFEIEHKLGDDWPQPAQGHKANLKHCPDDYYFVSGGCCPAYVFFLPFCFFIPRIPNIMNRGYYFFTAALGGQTPCWSPLSSTASVPPLTSKIEAEQGPTTTGTSGDPGEFEEASTGDGIEPAPTSAINNVIFSRHYPVDSPKGLSLGGYIGLALGISIPVSAAVSALFWFWRHRRKQRRERLRRAREQADYNRYTRIWDGPHRSEEHLFQGPGQELQTFNTPARGHMNTNDVYTTQQTSHLQQRQQYSGFKAVGRSTSDMNTDYTPGLPPPVRIPPRISSAAAATSAKYSYGQPISSTASEIPPVKDSGNPWGAHAVTDSFDSKGGQGPSNDSKGEKLTRVGKEEGNPFEEMVGVGASSSSAAGSSSSHSHNGNQQHRQSCQHLAEHPGHPAARAVPDRRESGYGLEEEEEQGYLEPPPEYKE